MNSNVFVGNLLARKFFEKLYVAEWHMMSVTKKQTFEQFLEIFFDDRDREPFLNVLKRNDLIQAISICDEFRPNSESRPTECHSADFYQYVIAWPSKSRPSQEKLSVFYAGLRQLGFLNTQTAPTIDEFKKFRRIVLRFYAYEKPVGREDPNQTLWLLHNRHIEDSE